MYKNDTSYESYLITSEDEHSYVSLFSLTHLFMSFGLESPGVWDFSNHVIKQFLYVSAICK